MKKKDIKVGQIIYVTIKSLFSKDKDNLTEFKVTRINTASIYAVAEGSSYETRFNKRTLDSKSSLDGYMKAFIDPEEYWSQIKVRDMKIKLLIKIEKGVRKLSLNQLEHIAEIMDRKQ